MQKSVETEWASGTSEFSWMGTFLFFFSVVLAFLIIGFSAFLVGTQFGQVSLIFGFFMLTASVVLKVTKRW